MRSYLKSYLKRFYRHEDGAAYTIEWLFIFPILMFILVSSWELGIYSFRQNFLDRGLDLAVRDVRLNTAISYTHSQVKQNICDKAIFLPNCLNNIKLEMKKIDPRNFSGFTQTADCIDRSQPLLPSRQFIHGGEHDIMVMRACYLYDPTFSHIGLGNTMIETSSGKGYPLVSVSVFVQEPAS